jgi:hypothetical protein
MLSRKNAMGYAGRGQKQILASLGLTSRERSKGAAKRGPARERYKMNAKTEGKTYRQELLCHKG